MKLILLVTACLAFQNTIVKRLLTPGSTSVREIVKIEAFSECSEKFYQFSLPAAQETAFVQVNGTVLYGSKRDGFVDYKVHVSIKSKELLSLRLELVHSNILSFVPKRIQQLEQVGVTLNANAILASPYPTEKTIVTISVPRHLRIAFSSNAIQNDRNLKFSFQKSKPFESKEIYCHYKTEVKTYLVNYLHRTLVISFHKNYVRSTYDYQLTNVGPELEAPFNRGIYQSRPSPSAIDVIPVPLPRGARDVYYRDFIGNVSTSIGKGDHLVLKPRFPMFGGWKFTCTFGFFSDLRNSISELDDKFVFKSSLVDAVKDSVVKEFQLDVILPEGATDIQLHMPLALETEPKIAKYYSFMDTIGRTVVRFRGRNLVDPHNVQFQIVFKYGSFEYLRKFIVSSLAFFACFGIAMLIGRIDVSIQGPKIKKE